ncbi:MAG: creatininase family protein [Deltaproteobacteria bacterium]|nr:creatininase family protein [Deltaproteobacteria bacterium]
MLLTDITMTEFEAGLRKTQSVIIPFGSTEEHGHHLPLDTDTLQALQVSIKLASQRPVFIAPPIHYGVCRSTVGHPGTISITTSTLKSLTTDIVTSLRAQGLRNFIFLTGHAGGTHFSALVDAGEELLRTFPDIRIAAVTEYHLAAQEGRKIIETPDDSHAGEIETSRLLHSHPHLVKGTSPSERPHFPMGILVRNKRRLWPGGVWGNPERASAEKGRRIEALVVAALGRLVSELEAWEEEPE